MSEAITEKQKLLKERVGILSQISGIGVILLGLLVLVGWSFDIPALKSLHPTLVSMKANTALCFLLAGLSLWLLGGSEVPGRYRRNLGRLFALIVGLIGLLTLCEYIFNLAPGIDQLLFKEPTGAIHTSHPGRMALNTAFNFLMTGIALFLLPQPTKRLSLCREWLALAVGLVAFLPLVGYIYSATTFEGVLSYSRMAVHTATGFLILSLGILATRPELGLMSSIASKGLGGRMARRLLPVAVILPLALGWVRLLGEKMGFYGTEFGLALSSSLNILLFSIFIFFSARALNQAEEELKRSEERLKVANKELAAFSYSVSHDLRAPLRSIDGFSQALLEDYQGKLDDSGRDCLRRIRVATHKMAQLIDDMLALARVTRTELRQEPVDLSRLAEETLQELKRGDPERVLECAVARGLVTRGDRNLLRILLANLLGNAWKFTSKTREARIELGMESNNGRPAYFVRDNGAGFDMAYADKLFGVFQRLHTASEYPGTGIGLATVRRIINRHGGRVWAEGAIGKGATFYFTL